MLRASALSLTAVGRDVASRKVYVAQFICGGGGWCNGKAKTKLGLLGLAAAFWQLRAKGAHMLTHCAVTTMLPVMDMDRARAFYEGCLGLTRGVLRPDGKFVYMVGGSALALFPKPGGTKAEHTAISFQVSDIAASVEELKGRGVVFEDYDFPDFKTLNHVCVLGSEKAAWFKDTEGNYLCIHQDLAPAGGEG